MSNKSILRNHLPHLAMLLMAVVMTLPLLTMTSCSNEDDPAPEGWPPAQDNVIDLSTLKAADLSGATLTLVDGDILTGTLDGTKEKVKILIAPGATVTLADAHVLGDHSYQTEWAGITCLGDATIILKGDNSVGPFYNACPCIQPGYNDTGKGDEYTLTIRGDGSLTLDPESFAETGIGAVEVNCGNIRIEGGTITAVNSQVGIGAFYATCGDITITGGTVTAQGKLFYPGIGCGVGSTCGNITITGGTVTATGAENAAGIGSGYRANDDPCTCGNITITGGTVKATGGKGGPGIGTGESAECGDITITGGTVYAQGGEEATGIGCGRASSSFPTTCGNITIGMGITRVTAIKGYNALRPIGHSSHNEDWNPCGNINIGEFKIYTAGRPTNEYYHIVDNELHFEEQTTDLGDLDEDDPNAYKGNTWVYTPWD